MLKKKVDSSGSRCEAAAGSMLVYHNVPLIAHFRDSVFRSLANAVVCHEVITTKCNERKHFTMTYTITLNIKSV